MPTLPSMNSLGKLCSSSRSKGVDRVRVKRNNSIKRMSIIEDGHVAEVLYLIPKQYMQHLPNIDPNEYYLSERLNDVATVARAQETHHHSSEKPLIQCYKCGEPCKGEVLRVQNKHFHLKCFTCKVCGCDLAQGGFFMKNGDYLCTLDYQRMHGTRCNGCGDFVEGEVVTALGKTYHPACFVCTICKRPFPAGDRVTFNGKDCLCQYCVEPMSPGPKDILGSSNCAGCGRDIKNGQALLALDKQWHLGCFKCKACNKVLTGEYISKDGAPYCEKDYQIHFGVQCEACHQFITGKVLEAGDKHYHPSCARCSRCNQMFTEGEEMYLQGSTVWHPGCKNTTRTEERHRERLLPPSLLFLQKTERQLCPSQLHTARRERSPLPDDKSSRNMSPTPSVTVWAPEIVTHAPPPLSDTTSSPIAKVRASLHSSPLPPLRQRITSIPTWDATSAFPAYVLFLVLLTGGTDPPSGRSSPLPLRPDSRPVTPPLSLTPKHFHLPDTDAIARQSKSADEIIRSATFPAAHAPSPDDSSRSEGDRWPCSLAVLGSEGGRRSREEEEEDTLKKKQIHEEHLSKVREIIQSGLGKLILKEEMEKDQIRERHTRSLSAQRYDPKQTDCDAESTSPTQTNSLPGYRRNGLHRPQSTDFTQYNSYSDICGGGRAH
ncbi:hypothetical protein JOQ06_020842 [Pogonophryne albipinna]|uniref:LIM zinc-binding domain-containing protein n=1 Tax=Pogonophryne albipinna TaxID=1090488 RepID=A0AAD6BST6_9TELE|nr:hypothetical protein JOQ06_020842 [Pogonophryne albipinna]